jgi:hypothetical protein
MIKILFWNPFTLTNFEEQKVQKKLKSLLLSKYKYKSDFTNYLEKENITYKMQDIDYLLKFQKELNNFDKKFYQEIYIENLETYLNSIVSRRREWSEKFTYFDLKTILKLQILAIEKFFIKNKYTHMFGSPLFSSGFDYLFFNMAKKFNIKTFYMQSYFRNKMFYSIDFNDFGEFKKSKKIFKKIKINKDILGKQNVFWMDNIEYYLQSKYGFKILFFNPLKIFQKKYFFNKMLSFKYNLRSYKFWKKENLRPFYSKNLPKNYIYLPLHFQAEATTIGLGSEYLNQADMIEKIHNKLPKGFKIILKEHPAQNIDNILRSDFFYKRINNLSNVLFTNVNDNTFDLIKGSKIVATITGTAGWEALKFKKPVITFGLAWYNYLNYVHKWNDKINLKKIAATKFNINMLKKSLLNLTKKMPDGMDCVDWAEQSDFTSNFEKEDFNFKKEIAIIGKSINLILNHHR